LPKIEVPKPEEIIKRDIIQETFKPSYILESKMDGPDLTFCIGDQVRPGIGHDLNQYHKVVNSEAYKASQSNIGTHVSWDHILSNAQTYMPWITHSYMKKFNHK
jgi:hypothetical protein